MHTRGVRHLSHIVAVTGIAITVVALVSIANAAAQSGDIIFIDAIDAGPRVDAGASTDQGRDDAAEPTIQIVGISEALPEVEVPSEPRNPRAELADAVVAHVKRCIATRTVDATSIDVGFLYLVRNGRPNATLTTVTNDEGLHVAREEVEILRSVGETRPIDIEDRRRIFLDCIRVVPLPKRPVVTEHLSFRIKKGALTLRAIDIEWKPL